jgi:hypothetical protein
VGRGFLVAGSQTGVRPTLSVDPMTTLCEDIEDLDPRIAMRIPMNAPRCEHVSPEAATLDSRCNPDPKVGGASCPNAAEMATKLRDLAKLAQEGAPNPCLFLGGPNETDPPTQSRQGEHVRALFRNEEVQFLMTNLEQSPAGVFQIRFEVHGGFRPQGVNIPPTVDIGMPTRIVLGPFDAQAPPEGTPDDVPYLFVVDQRRLGRVQGSGATRGQLLRIHPRGLPVTSPVSGALPTFEDFTKSGQLFPIQ